MSICAFAHCHNTVNNCPGIRFFKLPSLKTSEKHKHTRKLVKQRRAAWLNVINRKKLNQKYAYVCNSHFVNGAPSSDSDVEDCDWSPSLNTAPHVDTVLRTPAKSKTFQMVRSPASSVKSSPSKHIDVRDVCAMLEDDDSDASLELEDSDEDDAPSKSHKSSRNSSGQRYNHSSYYAEELPLSFMFLDHQEPENKCGITLFELLCGAKLHVQE